MNLYRSTRPLTTLSPGVLLRGVVLSRPTLGVRQKILRTFSAPNGGAQHLTRNVTSKTFAPVIRPTLVRDIPKIN